MQTTRQEALMDAVAEAAITNLASTITGLTVTATAEYDAGIGRVGFVLVDLTSDPLSDVVDRKDVDFARSPSHVTDAWASPVSLMPGIAYRVFFHVYDRSGVNLVAYDRKDFTHQ
ncbi:MAG: hypothetical protein WAQ33_01500 [Gaiellaceae bacterium]